CDHPAGPRMSYDGSSLIELFRVEAEAHTHVLSSGLLELERRPSDAAELEQCMRAAHSLKGAARIVGVDVGVRVAHALEDCLVAAQQGCITLGPEQITALLTATDVLNRVANTAEQDLEKWTADFAPDVDDCVQALVAILNPKVESGAGALPAPVTAPAAATRREAWTGRDNSDRVLRVTTENLNRLLGLAGESLVESRRLKPFGAALLKLKRIQHEACDAIEEANTSASTGRGLDEPARAALGRAHELVIECERLLAERLAEIEEFDRRTAGLSQRLHDEAIACRMRPFSDGIQAFSRMVRDLGQSLGKTVRLDIAGEATRVDRDILAALDAPLGHLLRNAVDHGVESPERRLAAGKPAEGVIRLEARHTAGLLQVTVADDGGGVDLEAIRTVVIDRELINREAAAKLSAPELLEFLFLPGFSMKDTVTEISGRGVGLDAVQDTVKRVHGTVRVSSQHGKGTQFQLLLPVTLSVVRTLLVEIAGEPYAFPLVGIVRTLRVNPHSLTLLEGRQHFDLEGRAVGVVDGRQALGLSVTAPPTDELNVVVIGDLNQPYGLVVDRFLGERERAVRPIDPLLGKVRDVSAAALMEDGSPVLIVDVQDLVRSLDRISTSGRFEKMVARSAGGVKRRTRRVLVVDDSLTVRELERKLLTSRGYVVDVAIDGMDGWNAVREGEFDLVVTDVDMPRMDGIELVRNITNDPRLQSTPVMIVSYKDREEERRRGLESGAAYYLTKGSFHNDSF